MGKLTEEPINKSWGGCQTCLYRRSFPTEFWKCGYHGGLYTENVMLRTGRSQCQEWEKWTWKKRYARPTAMVVYFVSLFAMATAGSLLFIRLLRLLGKL